MSADTPQDNGLHQLLVDTAELRRQYRATSQEEPPRQLDEAIRAAARRAVRARPGDFWMGASRRIPASVAAVVVVSLTLAVMVGRHSPQPALESEQRAPEPGLGVGAPKDRAEDATPAYRVSKEKAAASPARRAAQMGPKREEAPASHDVAESTAVEKVSRPAAAESKSSVRTGMELPVESARVAAPAGHEAAAPPAATAETNLVPVELEPAATKAKAEKAVPTQGLARNRAQATSPETDSSSAPWEKDPQAWLAQIENLRAMGHNQDAVVSFRAFRSRYPEYQLPAEFVVPKP